MMMNIICIVLNIYGIWIGFYVQKKRVVHAIEKETINSNTYRKLENYIETEVIFWHIFSPLKRPYIAYGPNILHPHTNTHDSTLWFCAGCVLYNTRYNNSSSSLHHGPISRTALQLFKFLLNSFVFEYFAFHEKKVKVCPILKEFEGSLHVYK